MIEIRSGEICSDGRPQPKPGDKYKIQVSVMDSPRLVSARSPEIMIPGQPDLVACVIVPSRIYLAVEKIKTTIELELRGDHVPGPIGPFKVKYYIEDLGTKEYTVTFDPHSRQITLNRDIQFFKPVNPNGEVKKIQVEIDPYNVVRESNENNNVISKNWAFLQVEPWYPGARTSSTRYYYKFCSDGRLYSKKGRKGTWKEVH
ncbi:MAG: hypothetical protein J7L62_05355 [Candidatus Aminicenantes bacterium]|nr:hypothetical protein [Candidatus Aminicenantes bacterium]